MSHLLYNLVMYLCQDIAASLFIWACVKYRLRGPNPAPRNIFFALIFSSMFMRRLSPVIFHEDTRSSPSWPLIVLMGANAMGFTVYAVYLLVHRKAPERPAAGNHIK